MLKEEESINLRLLEDIRDDSMNLPAVRLQAIQTLQKIMRLVEGEPQDDTTPTEESIMAKIRGGKK